jgi:hypothetical protein
MLTQEQINIVDEISSGMAILEGLDDAIIGFDSSTTRIIYDYEIILGILVEKHGISVDDAIEYIEYNIVSLHLTDEDGIDISPIIFNRFPFDSSDD